MNVAIIFAGGTGQRMNTGGTPKQFLELHGKPIIIYTLEHFERHELIDGIVVVCVEGWEEHLRRLLDRFRITKVASIVPGGATGLLSRFNGVRKAAELYPADTICLMHDGVRPVIDAGLIARNIECAERHGSAVTVAPAVETIAMATEDGLVGRIVDRSRCMMAKAPQTFRLSDLAEAHRAAVGSGMEDCIDTAYLMQLRGHAIHAVEGSTDNIKITTPVDFYTFRALMDARESSQIFGM